MCPTFFSSLKIRAMQRESHEPHAMPRSPYSQSNALHCKKSHIKWFSQPLTSNSLPDKSKFPHPRRIVQTMDVRQAVLDHGT